MKKIRSGGVEASTLGVDCHRLSSPREGRAVWAGRVIFLMCLFGVGGMLGLLTWYFLTGAERQLAKTQYESIANRALNEARAIALRKRLGTISMASVVAETRPDADIWPFITVPGFKKMATNVILTSSGTSMGLCPIVTPEQLPEFEKFMYKYYENTRNPPFPNGTAISSFGKGAWAKNASLNTYDKRYRDTNGATSWGSPNKILTPISQHSTGAHPVLMFNPHNQQTRGVAIDSIIECSARRAASDVPETFICGVMTDSLLLTSREADGPGAIIIQPIYPANNETVLSGILLSTIVWEEVLFNVFTASVKGVDCVIETETRIFTFAITDGVAKFRGDGDKHDYNYDDFRRSIKLSGEEYYNNASATYTLSLYPNIEHYRVYSTSNPVAATIGAVCVMIFMACLFVLYDVCVRREFSTKDELLESKRKFVRFVSHEVRTPLNSVSMGLTLMQDEFAGSLGYKSGEDYLQRHETAESLEEMCPLKQQTESWFNLSQDISVNAQSSVDVLNDLLNYDKVETGTLNLELTVIPIWKLIEKTTNEFHLSAAKKKIGFCVKFTDFKEEKSPLLSSNKKMSCLADMLPVKIRHHMLIGDTVRLTQVLRNLVSNALKFTPDGGKLEVRASWIDETPANKEKGGMSKNRLFVMKNGVEEWFQPSGHLQVQVQDTGAGMSKNQLEKLFRDGVQFNVNDLQAGQGSGLGLFIAKGIVEQHEGRLVADSEGLGNGTTFTMTLPMYYLQDTEEKPRSEVTGQNDECLAEPVQPCSLRVLVVDDATSNRKLLRRLLKNRGHGSDEAEDGAVALSMVKQAIKEGNPYDSILLDYEMPVMNGPTLATEIRVMGCDVFIIGVTGNMMADDVAYFRSCGANAMMGKPFKIAGLEEIWSEYGITGQTPAGDDIV